MKVSVNAIPKLTLLWAFAESGLGGLLHGFRLPVTGLVLGGFSVITISLIAHLSEKSGRDILRATILVLSIKFAASPHSPLSAYMAVFFQGVLGAFLFSVLGRTRVSVFVFAVVALLESAIQKPLMATLFLGTEVWSAIDELANKLMQNVGANTIHHFSRWLVGVYTSVHVLWGVVLGIWAFNLPERIDSVDKSTVLLEAYADKQHGLAMKKRSRSIGALLLFFLIGFLLVLYTLPSENRWTYLIRSFLIVTSVWLVILPLMKHLLRKWSHENSEGVASYWQALPQLMQQAQAAWQLAMSERSLYKRITRFVVYSFWLTLRVE